MKKQLILLLLCFCGMLYAEEKIPITAVANDTTIYPYVEKMAAYPGGMDSMLVFLRRNTIYPAVALDMGIKGKVNVEYVVNIDGSITDMKVLTPVHPLLDAEALRVVSLMPKWTPGEQYGKKVRVRFILPITYSISK